MRILKKNKIKVIPLTIKFILAIGIFYFAFILISQQNLVRSKKRKLNDIQSKLTMQDIKNKELKESLEKSKNNSAECLERLARENLDFIKKGERVFIVSGN